MFFYKPLISDLDINCKNGCTWFIADTNGLWGESKHFVPINDNDPVKLFLDSAYNSIKFNLV